MNDNELDADFDALTMDQMGGLAGGSDGGWAYDVVYGLSAIRYYAVSGWLKFVRTTPIDTAFL